MPKIGDDTQIITTNSNYKFSATKLNELGASEYTLATVLVDKSGSLYGYDSELENMLKTAIESCQKSPRSENLMIRVVTFDSTSNEIHGFKLLEQIDSADYANKIKTGGMTSLFDTAFEAVDATANFAEILTKQDYFANAIIYLITDGMDTASTRSANSVKQVVESTRKSECLESLAVVLIGMTGASDVQTYLDNFKKDAELDEYIDMGDVTKSSLAKLAGYISRSTTSTSQALGTGGPSQSLTI